MATSLVVRVRTYRPVVTKRSIESVIEMVKVGSLMPRHQWIGASSIFECSVRASSHDGDFCIGIEAVKIRGACPATTAARAYLT